MSGYPVLKEGQSVVQAAKVAIGTWKGGTEEVKKKSRIGDKLRRMRITVEELRKELFYDPLTGVLCKKCEEHAQPPNTYSKSSYSTITIRGVKVSVVQLAWYLHYGVVPNFSIQPKDGDYSNLKLSNFETKETRREDALRSCLPVSKPMSKSLAKKGGVWNARQASLPSVELVKSMIDYDPATGIMTSKVRTGGNISVGSVVGYSDRNGYRWVSINKQKFPAARVAWCLSYGEWPVDGEIDHINRDRGDNRLSNLRLVSREINQRNRGVNRNNKSGVIGVSFSSRCGMYVAGMTLNYKAFSIGMFDTMEEAVFKRWECEIQYGYPNAFTDSTALQYLLSNNLITMEEIDEYRETNRHS